MTLIRCSNKLKCMVASSIVLDERIGPGRHMKGVTIFNFSR